MGGFLSRWLWLQPTRRTHKLALKLPGETTTLLVLLWFFSLHFLFFFLLCFISYSWMPWIFDTQDAIFKNKTKKKQGKRKTEKNAVITWLFFFFLIVTMPKAAISQQKWQLKAWYNTAWSLSIRTFLHSSRSLCQQEIMVFICCLCNNVNEICVVKDSLLKTRPCHQKKTQQIVAIQHLPSIFCCFCAAAQIKLFTQFVHKDKEQRHRVCSQS